jgi:hypothetical protein
MTKRKKIVQADLIDLLLADGWLRAKMWLAMTAGLYFQTHSLSKLPSL